MSRRDDDVFFPRRFGTPIGHASERVLLDAIGDDVVNFRTRIKDNPDGSKTVMRTKGGMPEFVTIPARVASTPPDPDPDPGDTSVLHGAFIGSTFYPYNGANPTGASMPAVSAAYGDRGHTHFYNFRIPQNLTSLAASLAAIGTATDTALLHGGFSHYSWSTYGYAMQSDTTYPYDTWRSAWIYRVDAANVFLVFARRRFNLNGGSQTMALQKYAGQSWDMDVSVVARRVMPDGTLGADQELVPWTPNPVRNDSHLVYGNRLSPPIYNTSVGVTLTTSDNGRGFNGPPFAEINHSPTGDQAYYHFMVMGLNSAVKWATLQLLKITMSFTGGALSASMAVDMDEDDCFRFIGIPGRLPNPPSNAYARAETLSGNTKTISTVVTPNATAYSDFDHELRGLLLKGFDQSGSPLKLEWSSRSADNSVAATIPVVTTYSGAYARADESSPWVGSEVFEETSGSAGFERYFERLDILKNGVSTFAGGIYRNRVQQGATSTYTRREQHHPYAGIPTYPTTLSDTSAGSTISDSRGVLTQTQPGYSLSYSGNGTPPPGDNSMVRPGVVVSGLGAADQSTLMFEALTTGQVPLSAPNNYWAERCPIQIFTNNVVGIRYWYSRQEQTVPATYTQQRRTEYVALSSGDHKKDTGWHIEAVGYPWDVYDRPNDLYWVSWNPREPSLWLWENTYVAWL